MRIRRMGIIPGVHLIQMALKKSKMVNFLFDGIYKKWRRMSMKKYFAMLLTALLLASGGALAEGNSDVKELTFEMFYTEYGLPYEGEWICLDDAVYFYAPVELPQAEITDEMQADGVLASYSDTDEQGTNLRIVISREGNRDSVDTIAEELQAHCAKVIFVTINDLPAVMGTNTTEFDGDFEI